jgi:hypothetical protein
LSIWFAYRYRSHPTMRRALALGLALALAAMARTEMVLLAPLILLPLMLRTPGTTRTVRWERLFAAGAIVAVFVGSWAAYNLSRFDKPVLLSNGLGITLLAGNCQGAYYGQFIGYYDFRCVSAVEQRIKSWQLDQSVVDVDYRTTALDYMDAHKGRLAYVELVRWARYTGVWDLTHHWDQMYKDILPGGREPGVSKSAEAEWFLIAPLAVAGLFVLRRRRVPVYPVVAPVVVTLVAITLTYYETRYRAGAETAFCLLAAVAVDALWSWLGARRAARARAGVTAS